VGLSVCGVLRSALPPMLCALWTLQEAECSVRFERVEERFERQARNEALIRRVNEQIAALDERADWAAPEQQFEFQCECGSEGGCEGRVLMTLAEYERVRRQKDRFAVVPGHETAEIEYVVEEDERYVMVDKRDEVERLVE
jgi:hypothetical protein